MSALQAGPATVGDLLDQPQLRELKHLPASLRDIADSLSAVAFDDRRAMVDAIGIVRDAAAHLEKIQEPGAGHNQPPLGELLVEETATLKTRADVLLETAKDVEITDDESAENCTVLAKMISDHAATIEKLRKDRKQPFLDGCRDVDSHFNALKGPLDAAKAMLVGLIDKFRKQKEADAKAERDRLAEEQRKAEAAAEALAAEQRKAEAAAEALAADQRQAEANAEAAAAILAITGSAESAAEVEQAKARVEAVAAEAQTATAAVATAAAAVQTANTVVATTAVAANAAPKSTAIKSGLGPSAIGHKVAVVTLNEPIGQALTLACAYLIEQQPTVIRELVQSRYNALAKAGARQLPGAIVTEDSATSIR